MTRSATSPSIATRPSVRLAPSGRRLPPRAETNAPAANSPSLPAPRATVSAATFGLLVLLAAALAAVVLGDLATKIIVPLLAAAIVYGYSLGAARVLASFVALALAAVAAGPLGMLCEDWIAGLLGTTGVVNRLAAVAAVGLAVLLVSGGLLVWLSGRWLRNRPGWRTADRYTGAVLGGAQGALLICLATWGVLVLDSAAQGRLAADRQAAVAANSEAQGIVRLADSVRGSMFGPLAEKYNPLGEVKAFSMPSKFLKVVNHPEALAVFVEHPAVANIKERPAVVAALETLRQDPKVRELVSSGNRLNGADLAAILGSPATLKLIDESELIADLQPIAAEVEQALDDAVAVAEANPQAASIGDIPAGAISVQIHPPIQPWELTRRPADK